MTYRLAACSILLFACLSDLSAEQTAPPAQNPDVDRNGIVDTADLAIVKAQLGKKCGAAGFDARADVNRDCVVNVSDVSIVSRALGQKYLPTIVATVSPAPNANGWNNTDVNVSFACTGTPSCPAPVALTAEGAGQKVERTVSNAGGSASAVAVVNIDKTGPTVNIETSPVSNAEGWNNSPVTAAFTCTDSLSGVGVCPADQTMATEGKGGILSAVASDKAGNQAKAAATVNIDTTPPVITITSPANGTKVFSAGTTVSGTASDALSGLATVTCNGNSALQTGSTLSCAPILTVGSNVVSATATDIAGNSVEATLTLLYVRTPVITITSPTQLSYLSITPTTVTGTVDEPTAVVTVNSVQASATNGAFSVPLPIAEGPNVITATATAASGAVGTASVEVTLDTTPPRVTVTSPPDQFVTTEPSISIAGNVNDLVVGTVNDQQAQVRVKGAPALVSNRTFLATNVALALGSNAIDVVAIDRVGNSASTQITVTRQPVTQPRVQLLSGNNQTGPIGAVLQAPLVVKIMDATGTGVPNKPVIFKVTQNDGLVSTGGALAATVVATSNDLGEARVAWTVGQRAGAGGNVVEAYSVGFEGTAVFTATGALGQAGKIVVDTGNDQIGAINQPLPKPFVAVVVDAGNNRLAGVPVTFTAIQGGGTFDDRDTVTTTSDSDGRVAATLTLGMQEGNANNLVQADFPSNPGLPAVFTASGRAPGDPAKTTISGVILDNSNVPVPGAIVRAVLTNVLRSNLAAIQSAPSSQTNSQGQFLITQAPAGLIKLLIDGTTVQKPGTYPSLEYDLVTVAGQSNNVGQPIYLLALNAANQLCVTATSGGGTLSIADAPGFSLSFTPGQVTFPGGSKTGCISVTVVHSDKVPMVPGFGQQPRFIVTIQPSGAIFSPPAAMTLPNVDGLRPRQVTEMYSFDHDIGSFVAIGTGVVSDDGLVIRSSPGVGVLKAGWFCGGDPNPTGGAGTCPACQSCNGTQCVNDDSQVPMGPPPVCTQMACKNGASTTVPDPAQNGQQCQTAAVPKGACNNGQCIPVAGVQIVEPPDGTQPAITSVPAMPKIDAKAVVVGVTPDPTASTSFSWTAELKFDATACSHGIAARSHTLTTSGTTTGGKFSPVFNAIRGGDLKLKATATVDGKQSEDESSGLQIVGTNPQRSAIQAELDHDTLRRIACRESNQRQFDAAANGGTSLCPLFSGDNLGGVGIMQITKPAPTADQIWNWKANVQRGNELFKEKEGAASGFPQQVRTSNDFRALVNALNATRAAQMLPPITVTLPNYTTGDFDSNLQQFELDTLRGYNGYGAVGSGQFGFRMHEFQVVLDAAGALVVDANGVASWVQIPGADRPHCDTCGDPDYVENILARNPLCGG